MHSASARGSSYGFGWYDEGARPLAAVYHTGALPTFTAFEGMFQHGRYGVAVLSNAGMTLVRGGRAQYIAWGIARMGKGQRPVSFGEAATAIDAPLSVVAIVVLLTAAVSVFRTRRWAANRIGEPIWLIGLRFAPWLAALLLVASIPGIVGELFGGRAASWLWISYVSPMLAGVSGVVIISGAAVLISRALGLWALRKRALGRQPATTL